MPTRPRQGFLQDAAALLEAGTPWAGLGGDSLAFVLASVAREGRWLIVVDDADRAERLVEGLRFFHRDPNRVEPFPADDHRPYDGFSATASVVASRLRTLERVARKGDLIVVAEARALRQRVPDRATRRKGTRQIAVGDTLDRDALVRWLTDAGYLAAGLADAPGRFAVRGDVVDVWSTAASGASRVEFFDDEVESLRRLTAELRPGRKRSRLSILPAREERIDADARERLADVLHGPVVWWRTWRQGYAPALWRTCCPPWFPPRPPWRPWRTCARWWCSLWTCPPSSGTTKTRPVAATTC
jgi:transcription-repair coupling factor (superfamily II helicase)